MKPVADLGYAQGMQMGKEINSRFETFHWHRLLDFSASKQLAMA